MSINTMGSQGDCGGELELSLVGKGGSIYSLTLDEVENQFGDLGKPLGSMNFDELLKNILTIEANREAVAGASGGKNSTTTTRQWLVQRRGLSEKTVDEVWREIHKDIHTSEEMKRKLGEMTLEDFLVKAGVVDDENFRREGHWMLYPHPHHHDNHHNNQKNHHQQGDRMRGFGSFPETQMSMATLALVGTLSNTQISEGKRIFVGGVIEKTVERRQKRMIKNRESAARSRARKQAYTHELENKVSRLEEENEKLKRQKVLRQEASAVEVEKILPCGPLPKPINQLRRISSATF